MCKLRGHFSKPRGTGYSKDNRKKTAENHPSFDLDEWERLAKDFPLGEDITGPDQQDGIE